MPKYKTYCAIIFNEKGEFLLTRRNREPFLGRWALVSGIGESRNGVGAEEGVINEVAADLGTNSFSGTKQFSILIEGDAHTDEVIVFAGTIHEYEITINPTYSAGYSWVPREKIPELGELAFEHGNLIQKYLAEHI